MLIPVNMDCFARFVFHAPTFCDTKAAIDCIQSTRYEHGKIYNLAGITVAYALSPIDLIPDFIPITGYLDDVILLPMLVALTIKFIPKSVLERERKESEDLWKDGKPKKWYYAILIIIIWIIILIILLKIIF